MMAQWDFLAGGTLERMVRAVVGGVCDVQNFAAIVVLAVTLHETINESSRSEMYECENGVGS